MLRFASRGSLHDAVVGDDLFVKHGAEFWGALLSFEIDVGDAEALFVAIGPLVVVEEAPKEVALDGNAFGDGALELGEVIAEVHDAVGVVDVTVRGDDVGGGAAVFGDVDRLGMPELVGEFRAPVEGLRAYGE